MGRRLQRGCLHGKLLVTVVPYAASQGRKIELDIELVKVDPEIENRHHEREDGVSLCK